MNDVGDRVAGQTTERGSDPTGEPPADAPQQLDSDTLRNLMRLALGGAFEGSAELARRLEHWQAQAGEAAEPQATPLTGESDLARLRFALVGLMFEAPDVVERGARVLGSATRTSTGFLSRVIGPLASSRAARPVLRRYDAFVDDRLSALERWIAVGRAEEQSSRAMVRDLTDEEVNTVIEYLADKPEVRELIQEQSLSMADDAVGELRGQTASADRLIERIVSSSLRRRPADVGPAPPPSLPNRARASGREKKSG